MERLLGHGALVW